MSTTTQQALIESITRRKNELGITAKDLYEKAGISKPAFFRKMKGAVDFTTSDLDAIAAALDCTIEVLLTPNEH